MEISEVMMGHDGGPRMGRLHKMSQLCGPEENFGGYECNFLESPPSAFQTECPICHLILREPFQAICCGTNFCFTCIQRIFLEDKPCPICRKENQNLELFPNKGLKHSLMKLEVCYTHKDGSQWRGELGELDQHLKVSYRNCHSYIIRSLT